MNTLHFVDIPPLMETSEGYTARSKQHKSTRRNIWKYWQIVRDKMYEKRGNLRRSSDHRPGRKKAGAEHKKNEATER